MLGNISPAFDVSKKCSVTILNCIDLPCTPFSCNNNLEIVYVTSSYKNTTGITIFAEKENVMVRKPLYEKNYVFSNSNLVTTIIVPSNYKSTTFCGKSVSTIGEIASEEKIAKCGNTFDDCTMLLSELKTSILN